MSHNHLTRDIKPVGQCPACDIYHEKRTPPKSVDLCKHCGEGNDICICFICKDCDSTNDIQDNGLCAECNKENDELKNTASNEGRHE